MLFRSDPLALTARADGVRLRKDVERLLDDPMTPLAVRLALLSVWREAPKDAHVKNAKRADPVSLACPHCGGGLTMAPRVEVEVEVGSEDEASEASVPSPAAPAAPEGEAPMDDPTEEEPMRGALAGILRAQLARP